MSENTMTAVVEYGPANLRLEPVPIPVASPKDLVIEIEACGVCTSDVKAWHGAPRYWGGNGQPKWIREPVIPGHEFLGHIVELGPEVEGFAIGDRVITDQIIPCAKCRYCRRGEYWMCERHDMYGFQVNGGWTKYMKIVEDSVPYLYKVPPEIPTDAAVLLEPFACSYHTVERAQIHLDDVVVLSGAGPLGLGMIGPIKRQGPRALVVLDLKSERLAVAKQFGADYVASPATDNYEQLIADLTNGYGCDVYIEAASSGQSVLQGLKLLRKRGTFVEMSVFGGDVAADWSIIGDSKELTIYGSHLGPFCYPRVIQGMLDGWIPTEGVVTATLPLAEFEHGLKLMETGENGSIKAILKP
jgi:threonine dehydrogenase-like Zn-dependent dehydrogenase